MVKKSLTLISLSTILTASAYGLMPATLKDKLINDALTKKMATTHATENEMPDFTGKWLGQCTDSITGMETGSSLEITQHDKEITFIMEGESESVMVGDLNTNVNSNKDGSNTEINYAHWNAENQALILRSATGSTYDNHDYSLFGNDTSSLSLDNNQLKLNTMFSIEDFNVNVDCSYSKEKAEDNSGNSQE